MELRQLRYFIKAAELSNFTEAANALFISQSTLSQQIQQLENELKTPLFDRIAKRVRLTEAGKLFLPAARKTIRDGEDGKQLLKDLNELTAGTLAIGLTYGLSDLVIKSLKIFTDNYPKILVQVIYGTPDGLIEFLSEGRIDFLLSFISHQHSPIFESILLFESKLSLIVSGNHPMAKKTNIRLSDISALPLALPVTNFSIREFLDLALARQQLLLDIRLEANDINILLQLADAGTWCTILMASSIFNFPNLKAIPITGKEMVRQATITWPKDTYRKTATRTFIDIIQIQASNQVFA